jgi:hypothetical protein
MIYSFPKTRDSQPRLGGAKAQADTHMSITIAERVLAVAGSADG